jgi:hypothetical protein
MAIKDKERHTVENKAYNQNPIVQAMKSAKRKRKRNDPAANKKPMTS